MLFIVHCYRWRTRYQWYCLVCRFVWQHSKHNDSWWDNNLILSSSLPPNLQMILHYNMGVSTQFLLGSMHGATPNPVPSPSSPTVATLAALSGNINIKSLIMVPITSVSHINQQVLLNMRLTVSHWLVDNEVLVLLVGSPIDGTPMPSSPTASPPLGSPSMLHDSKCHNFIVFFCITPVWYYCPLLWMFF